MTHSINDKTISGLGSFRTYGSLRCVDSFLWDGPLLIYDSLSCIGSIGFIDSLPQHGALYTPGSFCVYGSLTFIDSFLINGFLTLADSFPACGSLR